MFISENHVSREITQIGFEVYIKLENHATLCSSARLFMLEFTSTALRVL